MDTSQICYSTAGVKSWKFQQMFVSKHSFIAAFKPTIGSRQHPEISVIMKSNLQHPEGGSLKSEFCEETRKF